ncbi:MAG TPA: ABC transporter substrate-binding protein [Streptosporangiaceae bacterium]|nr:ABC transporter substrate-binding protein [Streptosporangiaceae bacterium]
MKNRLRTLGVITAVACSLVVTACAGSTTKSGRGGTLTISNENGGLWTCGFNPFNSSTNLLSTGNVYEPLVFVNTLQNQKVTPWLASSYAWSNNNKTVTFTVRDGVKWNDGQPMTASDVLFTFNLVHKFPALDINSIWSVIDTVSRQASNIVVNFKTPAVPYFYYIGDQLPIVPEHIWSSIKDPATFADEHPVATGAYMVNPCTPQNITYTANPHYWQPGLPKVAKVLYPAFTSNDPANTYLATGQAQWGSQFIPNIDTFYTKKSKDHHTWSPPTAQVVLFPNEKVAPLNDPVVRQALAYATDRNKASSIGEGGQEPPANQLGVVSPTFDSWIDPAAKAADTYTYDPAKVATLLEGAGYKKGSDGIYASPQGKRLSFNVINKGGYSDWVAAMKVVQDGMKAAGIELKASNLSDDDFNSKLFNGNFDLAYYSEPLAGPSPYYELRAWLYSQGSAPIGKPATSNFERYEVKATDALFDSFAATGDPATQKQIIAQLEQIMLKDVPIIPVTQSVNWFQYNTAKFTGWPTPDNQYALPAAFQYPDMGQVLLHLQPK